MIDRVHLIGEFVAVVADMRHWQRKFYAAQPHTGQRARALRESKKLEQRTDELVRLLQSPAETAEKGPLL